MTSISRLATLVAASTLAWACAAGSAFAGSLPADVQAKVDKARKHLVELAADPGVGGGRRGGPPPPPRGG